jgi:glycosyltransferase involved in cell wall biosynthesis
MNLSDITPIVLTFNEEANLARCLERLVWASEVVVVDSHSTDRTQEIASSFTNVRFVQRAFDDHTTQWNFAVSLSKSPWVLSLDADYVISPEFSTEAGALDPPLDTNAYFARFRYCIMGKMLRASLYPPRAILFRRDACTYTEDGHTQLLRVEGNTGELHSEVLHDDRKPLGRWLQSQLKYAELEAAHLLRSPVDRLNHADRLRRGGVAAPAAVFLYTLLARGLLLDGLAGWFYVLQRTTTECMIALHLLHRRLLQRSSNP